MPDDVTVTIETEDGTSDTLELPASIIDALREEGDTTAQVISDVAVMAFTGRAHAIVHHAEGGAGEDLEAAEEAMLERFEDRFGMTYAEATGHSH